MKGPVLFLSVLFVGLCAAAQKKDTLIVRPGQLHNEKIVAERAEDSARKSVIRRTVIHSAIIPGWGQIDNKKIWKVPLIYGALGTTAYFFFYNLKEFRTARNAYRLATGGDTSQFKFIPQPYYSVRFYPDRILSYRNAVRQNVDYTVLYFLGFWGLNVADAAVDAHLKHFDVSDEITMRIHAGYNQMGNNIGIGLVFNLKDKKQFQ